MAGLKDNNLRGQTVKYGDIQFGGADAIYRGSRLYMMPPEYSIRGDFVYDDADRACTHTRYLLTVSTIVYNTTETLQSRQMDVIHDKLSEPGKPLLISGLGCGFQRYRFDQIWGPKPRGISIRPIGGQFAWELLWTVEFNANMRHVATGSATDLDGVMAFNFATTWDYNFEGVATRTIRGYISTPQTRSATDPHQIIGTRVADNRRHMVRIAVPDQCRRLGFTWNENEAKNRLEFQVTDRQFDAEPFPTGCSDASGNYGIEADGVGFSKGRASLNVSLTTRPGVYRGLALVAFLRIALAKQAALLKAASANPKEKSTVLINGMSVNHRLFSRTTDFSASWLLTRCVQNFMFSSGIWEPVAGTDFTQWSTDMSRVWDQRGVAPSMYSHADEQIIIDLTNGTSIPNPIGKASGIFNANGLHNPPKFPCPDDLPADMTWLDYEVRLRVYKENPVAVHSKAVTQAIEDLRDAGSKNVSAYIAKLGKGELKFLPDEAPIIETMGLPVTYIGLQFKGLRIKYMPDIPTIVKTEKKDAHLIKAIGGVPWHAFSILDCPVWAVQRSALYRITGGDVTEVKSVGSPTKCGGNDPAKVQVSPGDNPSLQV